MRKANNANVYIGQSLVWINKASVHMNSIHLIHSNKTP